MTGMKKWIGIIVGIGALWAFCTGFRSFARQEEMTPVSMPVKVNEEWFEGKGILRDEEGRNYISFTDLEQSMKAEQEAEDPWLPFRNEEGWHVNGQLLPADSRDLLQVGEEVYICLDAIPSLLGYHTYAGKVFYIDNFPKLDYSWAEDRRIVRHACGGIDGIPYTNSREAMEYWYEQGSRLFEIDFCMAADQVLVAGHDWDYLYKITGTALEEGAIVQPMTSADYQQLKIYGKYTPLTFPDIAAFMEAHPDMYIITDTKDTRDPQVTETFDYMRNNASEAVLDRIIPQVYNNAMYESLKRIYDWKSAVYTFYNQGQEFSYESCLQYAVRNGIMVVTTYQARSEGLFFHEFMDRGGRIYMHTYNEEAEVDQLLERKKIWGVYSDFLPEDLFESGQESLPEALHE